VVSAVFKERCLTRVAFPLIGSINLPGSGVYNYLVNLMRVLAEHAKDRIQPVLFAGTDVPTANVEPFVAISGVEVVQAADFDDEKRGQRLRDALMTGCDHAAAQSLQKHRIDVLFESAQYCGWRFPFPTIAWFPDFQHRHLREMFSFGAYWKRDLGFRAQVLSRRHIMLSSEDSRRDCERFFPQSIGRTSVVHFAVLPPDASDFEGIRRIVANYKLPEHFFYLPNQFWKHKNHQTVIEALHILKQQGFDLVVAASGKPEDYRHPEHYKALQSLVVSLGLKHNFRFLGIVPREHVFALMRSCTAMINPSLSEGWSSTVEEAKSLGVPMLLSDLSVHLEQAGDSALFFDRHKAEQLAALMSQHKHLSVSSRLEMEQLAFAVSRNRLSQFAKDFLYTVERTLA
jgi:glycosyltransferase involved in cell wall biosynthesis